MSDPGSREDQRHVGRPFPQRVFSGDILFAQVPSVVAPQTDDCVVAVRRFFECGKYAADLAVDKTDAGQIGMHQVLLLVVSFQPTHARLGQFPVQVPTERRTIEPVVASIRWQQQRFIVVKFPPLRRDVTGNVWQEETTAHEERFVVGHRTELFCHPVSHNVIAFVLIAVFEHAPVHQRMIADRCHRNQLLGRLHTGDSGRTNLIEFGFVAAVATVINLARGVRSVPMSFEVLRQRDSIFPFWQITKPGCQAVDAGRRRTQREHQTGSRRIAQRRLAMSVGERHATFGQRLHRRRLDLRMPAQRFHPVVQVVDANHQDIGTTG